MRKNPTYTALLRSTRLLISEKSGTYTIKWSYKIIWQVRVPDPTNKQLVLNLGVQFWKIGCLIRRKKQFTFVHSIKIWHSDGYKNGIPETANNKKKCTKYENLIIESKVAPLCSTFGKVTQWGKIRSELRKDRSQNPLSIQ